MHKAHANVEVAIVQVILNARVTADPERLETIVRESIEAVAKADSLQLKIGAIRRLPPGHPQPTHRIKLS